VDTKQSKTIVSTSSDDKYKDKPLRFKDCDTHYELIFVDEFEYPNKEYTVAADILIDLKDADKSKELHIYINSMGGFVCNLSMLLQQVLEFKYVVTIASGTCMSCGFLLFCCGHERYVSPFSALLYHGISGMSWGKGVEISAYGKHLEEALALYVKVLGVDKLLTKQELTKGETTELWFLGQEFIKREIAKDYASFKDRTIPSKTEFITRNGRYFKLEKDKFVEYKKIDKVMLTYQEIIAIEEKLDEKK